MYMLHICGYGCVNICISKYSILLFRARWTTNPTQFYYAYLSLYLFKNYLAFLFKPPLMTA